MELWFERPAGTWNKALPVGNGRMGAMVFGRTGTERIQINEESIWAGERMNDHPSGAVKHLDRIRELIVRGNNGKARSLASKHLLARPPKLRSYQPLMDLTLDLPDGKVRGYRRSLDLHDGIARTSYRKNGVRHTRSVFASAPDDLIVVRWTADQPGAISGSLGLTRPADADVRVTSDRELLLDGQVTWEAGDGKGSAGKGVEFAGRLRVRTDGGRVTTGEKTLRISDANAVTLLISSATNYDRDRLGADPDVDPVAETARDLKDVTVYKTLLRRQIRDHSRRMERVRFEVGESGAPPESIPTDKRLLRVKSGNEDAHLAELYFQVGRYLLLGSSRSPGRLPANLQGLWNAQMEAPWESDYHTNINLQMNYWPAEVTNIAETTRPLIGFVNEWRKPGGKAAEEMYGAGGWTLHHNTDLFGRMGVHDAIKWGMFPMAGPWMTMPVWRHYTYSRDRSYLKDMAYPIMKGSARFVLDFLVEGPDGHLVTAPSYSPENSFVHPETGEKTRLTYAPTMDVQIIRELFRNTIRAAEILETDDGLRQRMNDALDQLPPVRVGSDGTIREWIKAYEEVNPGHRHMSHLFGLHPGSTITPGTPELYRAARKTIEKRLTAGGGHTGWSRAWIINFYARLKDGQAARKHLLALFRKSTLYNLLDVHPPFQIDGNFGGTAGIAELLIQSHRGFVHLLPALPPGWSNGTVTGLRAQGGFEVDMRWTDGQLMRARVTSTAGETCRLKSPVPVTVRGPDGRRLASGEDPQEMLTFETRAGETYRVRPR